MRRRRPALAALLLAFLVGYGLAQTVQLESRVFEIARQLRCPTCISESVADSSAAISQQMREIIHDMLAEGKDEPEILAYFQARYGDWILLDPPKRGIHLVVWLLPIVIGALAITVVALLARRWVANSNKTIEVSPEQLAKVRRQLAASNGGAAAPDAEPENEP